MRRTSILAVIPVCVAIVSCARAVDQSTAGDDIAVLKGITQSDCAADNTRRILVSDEPAKADSPSNLPPELEKMFREGIEARSAENSRWPLLTICDKARVVPGKEIAAFFAKDPRIPAGWENFESTFGAGAYIRVSRPAYSADHDRALVFIGTHCGVLCGHGHVVELEKTAAGWKVSHSFSTWIS